MIDRIANEVAIQCMDCGIITDIRQFKDILVMALNNYTVSPKEKAIAVYDDLSKGYQMFFVTKKVKGLSDKSLKYYKCVMAVAYCLRKTFGWGKIKIYRYAVDMNRYITSVGKQDRDIPALNDELRTEAGIDCTKIFEGYKPYMLKKVSLQKSSEAEAMFEKIKYILPMVIYPLYSREGWKQKRMNRLGQALKETLIDILESDEIDNIKRTMYEECGLKFYDDGTVDPN